MKVLHVVPTYLPATRYGGPIYSVHALCRALVEQGHDVDVFTTNVDGPGVSDVPLSTPVVRDGVRVHYFPTSFGRRLYRSPAMARALADPFHRYDVVHLHSVFLWPTAAGAAAARRYSIPYVLAPRGMLVRDLIRRRSRLVKSAWIAAVERRNLAAAAAVHVTAEIEAADIAELGLRTRRIAVIPNGVDLPAHINCRVASEPAHAPTILSLGRLNWKKGIDRLIRAMPALPGARLVVAGDDEDGYRRTLEGLARDVGVAERIEFAGPVHGSGKWDLLAAADVFALPSHNENFGNAVLEAMGAGVPVVVTPQVGLARVVADAQAGLVVPGEPTALAQAISRLLDDAPLRRRMGEAGRRTATERFSWRQIARQTEDLYQELAATVANDRMRRG